MLLKIFLAIGGVVGAYFLLINVRETSDAVKRRLRVVFGILFGGFLLYYLADTGEDFSRPVACTIFFWGKTCKSKAAAASEPQKPPASIAPPDVAVTPARPAPTPEPPVESRPPAPSAPRPEWTNLPVGRPRPYAVPETDQTFSGPIDGEWWPVQTPQAPAMAERAAWEDVERHPGACEPLRRYAYQYPNGPSGGQASRRLRGIRTTTLTKTIVTPMRVGPYIQTRARSSVMAEPPESACQGVVGWENAANNGTCHGMIVGERLRGRNSTLQSVVTMNSPADCICERKAPTQDYACRVRVDFTCNISRVWKIKVETCPPS